MQITGAQYNLLTSFFCHCFNVFHEGNSDNFSWWAEKLDKAKIPWRIQNTVSAIATNKASTRLYLSTHLKNKGVTVV